MKPDVQRAKAKAAEAFAKGSFKKAAELYEEYLASVPSDHQIRLRLGDAYARIGQKNQAITAYFASSQGFARDGFLPRAIAAGKLVLTLDPTHLAVQEFLSQLNSKKVSAKSLPQKDFSPLGTESRPREIAVDFGPETLPAENFIIGSEDAAPKPEIDLSLPPPAPAVIAPPPPPAALARPPPLPIDLEMPPEHTLPFGVAPAPAAPPQPSPFELTDAELGRDKPQFTELDIDGDSMLQSIEAMSTEAPSDEPQPIENADEFGDIVEGVADDASGASTTGVLRKILLFSDLPEDAFMALFLRCPFLRFDTGAPVMNQGDRGESFFVICAGKVRIARNEGSGEKHIAFLSEGAFFGEMALLSEAPRSASVYAVEDDTQLLEIPAAVLLELSKEYPSISVALKKFCRQRLLSNVMKTSPLFQIFSHTDRRKLVERFMAREVASGTFVINAGRESDGLFIVLSGEVSVSIAGHEVARLREGEVFGEISLLTGQPANASVISVRKTSLLRLPPEEFHRWAAQYPKFRQLIEQVTDLRTQENVSRWLKTQVNESTLV